MTGVGPVRRVKALQSAGLPRRVGLVLSVSCGLVFLIAACAATPCAPRPAASSAPQGLGKFYQSMDAVKAGTRTKPLTVLHLGDSHIALDHMTGVLRQNWAAVFGDGGRMMPAGLPYPYFSPQGYHVSMTHDWVVASSLRSGSAGPFGISGFRVSASDPHAQMSMAMDTSFDMVEIEAYGGPRSGSLLLSLGGAAPLKLSTRSAKDGVVFLRVPAAHASHATLTPAGDGPLALLGWSFLKNDGLRYSSLGISGASVDVVSHWDDAIVDAEVARLSPDLIMLGYGTNEGFNDGADAGAYARRYDALVSRLQRLAPDASIVALGALDGARHAKPTDKQTCGDGYAVPPKLAVLREAQRNVMQKHGGAFVDMSAAMGGACGIEHWVAAEPPLAWPDHVHLRPAGARMAGNRLWVALMQPFETAVCMAPQ
ncbi:MAG: GDSL-type esterase/lipase family protein [Parvibaculaceae bacterium]